MRVVLKLLVPCLFILKIECSHVENRSSRQFERFDGSKYYAKSKFFSAYNLTSIGTGTRKNPENVSSENTAGILARQGRQSRVISASGSQPSSNGYYSPEYSYGVQDAAAYAPYMVEPEVMPPIYLEPPPHAYEEEGQVELEHHEPGVVEPEHHEEDEEEEEEEDDEQEDEQGDDAATTPAPTAVATTTTTLPPFTLADVKVPAPFLRIEYMIGFTFFGLMYGLGFFVLFQSLCVPAAKYAVYIVYMVLLTLGVVSPISLDKALEQLPPT